MERDTRSSILVIGYGFFFLFFEGIGRLFVDAMFICRSKGGVQFFAGQLFTTSRIIVQKACCAFVRFGKVYREPRKNFEYARQSVMKIIIFKY